MEDLNDKVTGGTLTATEWNQVPSEIQNVIEESGIVLTSLDVAQQLQSIYNIVRRGLLFIDSGVANNYVLSSAQSQAATQYRDGMTVVFDNSNVNTGASTIDIDGLGVQTITDGYGSVGVINSGSIISGLNTLIYDGANFSVYLSSVNAIYDNNTYVEFRNAADTLDLNAFGLDSFDRTAIDCNAATLRINDAAAININNTSASSMFNILETGPTLLSYNSSTTLRTADTTDTANSSGASVLDVGGTDRSVGFNVLPSIFISAGTTLTRALGGNLVNSNSGTNNILTLDTDANLPIGYTVMITNTGGSDLTIVLPVGILRYLDGSGALNSGDRILTISGICTVTKLDTSIYAIYGNGIT